jgi:glycerol transport system ATP-binding protein
MNVLPCDVRGGRAIFAGEAIETANGAAHDGEGKGFELGVRPEFVSFASAGVPVDVVKVLDVGRYRIVEATHGGHTIKMLVPEDESIPQGSARLRFAPERTRIYKNGWVVT